jgi:predicted  nucleic acid-binding Zn-ribbon protein
MDEDIRHLLMVQHLDEEIARHDAEIDALPKHIAEIRKRLRSHQERLQADKAALATNQKQTRDLEGEVAVHRQKISRLKDQMMQAKTNEQYKAFQQEITFHEQGIRAAEDREIELLEEAETLGANVRVAETALKEEEASVNAEAAEAEKRVALVRKERDDFEAERQQLITKLSADVKASYLSMKAKGRKRVVAEVVEGKCSACNITVRLQVIQDLELTGNRYRCENCMVFLYMVPVTAVDEHGPSTTSV